jgi:hypothetical protein
MRREPISPARSDVLRLLRRQEWGERTPGRRLERALQGQQIVGRARGHRTRSR